MTDATSPNPAAPAKRQGKTRAPLQAPIGPVRICVLYLVNGQERRTPWLHSKERAQAALRIMQAKYGARNVCLYVD